MATAAAAPVLRRWLLVAAFAASELLGWTPSPTRCRRTWPRRPLSDSGRRCAASSIAGQDPALVYAVRPDAISSAITRATALEAAVWGRSERLIRMLDRMGSIDAPTRRHMACLAEDIRPEDIKTTLAGSGVPTCVPGAAYSLVQNRGR